MNEMIDLIQIGMKAKETSRYASRLKTTAKNEILLACADAIEAEADYLIRENKKDMDAADKKNAVLLDRLLLTGPRVKSIASGMREVAAANDPIGEVLYMKTMPNGLSIGEKRVPLGVVGIIYESRPNVTADVFMLCVKSGNACILRGGSEAINSNIAIVSVIQRTLAALKHPPELVQLITDTSRETATEFMKLNEYVDVLFPRGTMSLINAVIENSNIPVVETGIGNCHIFVDESADLERAVKVIINAKTSRPGICNACEKLLIHEAVADKFIPVIGNELQKHNVEIRGDEKVCSALPFAKPASEDDWYEEHLSLVISVRVIANIDEAIGHINHYGSSHSDAILTESYSNALRFTDEVDSAAVYVNASTRFTDGGEFGLGAEMGISTQKLHARGPMGLKALTSTKFIIFGNGQIRE